MATTRKAGPPELMMLETSYLKALVSTQQVDVSEQGIRLSSNDGQTVLEFAADVPQAHLVVRTLKLSSLTESGERVTLPDQPWLTLQLGDRQVSGFSGVNQYFGSWGVGELGTIVWGGPFGSTRMAGPPELMELERRFLNALMRATHVRLTETGLGLEDEASGSVLVFDSL